MALRVFSKSEGTLRNAEEAQRGAEKDNQILRVSLRLLSAFLCVPLTLEKPWPTASGAMSATVMAGR
jgi:hypothetical protein